MEKCASQVFKDSQACFKRLRVITYCYIVVRFSSINWTNWHLFRTTHDRFDSAMHPASLTMEPAAIARSRDFLKRRSSSLWNGFP